MINQTSKEFSGEAKRNGSAEANLFEDFLESEDAITEEKDRSKDRDNKDAFNNKAKPQNDEAADLYENAFELGGKTKQQDPPSQKWDEKIIAENRKKFPKQIERIEAYREAMMKTYGVNMALPLDIPFQAGRTFSDNDLKPSVFLGKLIDKVEIVKSKDESRQDIVVTQYEHVRIGYQETKTGDQKTAAFMATNFINDHDLKGKDEVDAKRAIIEIVKTALIMAENAKAAGWTEVNFGRTTDPIKRYAMVQACKHVGLVCSSEIVNANDLPTDNVLGRKIDLHIAAYADRISEKIFTPMEKQGTPHVQTPGQNAQKDPQPQPMGV